MKCGFQMKCALATYIILLHIILLLYIILLFILLLYQFLIASAPLTIPTILKVYFEGVNF